MNDFTFGVTIEVFEPSEDPDAPPQSRKFSVTGRFPSPAYADLEAVVNAAVGFLNGQLGTKFQAVRVYGEDEVEEVKLGEWQRIES